MCDHPIQPSLPLWLHTIKVGFDRRSSPCNDASVKVEGLWQRNRTRTQYPHPLAFVHWKPDNKNREQRRRQWACCLASR
uniref:Uncharacterized protein n=1 Tax=Aegilops tauschii subsp. strangulata TaxID=200361 RepID=A0A453NN93_AEGTS